MRRSTWLVLTTLKRTFKPFVPLVLRHQWNRYVNRRRNFRQSASEAFGTIYSGKHWGGAEHDFYSGPGSHTTDVVEPFIRSVRSLLSTYPRSPTVVDIGCGDFTVGSRLVDLARDYVACDVVPALIERNRRKFGQTNVTFKVVDAIVDPLPPGDVVIVRQVFQHLRNDQIIAIVRKLSQYPTWIVSEHLPAGEFRPNRDKLADNDNRLPLNSGIVVTAKPFHIKPKSSTILCESATDDGVIRTIAYRF
jgi:SAM-dependent methyltransferase